ncbi:MAG: hypothetical protein U1E22_09275, partial [Coriobacteriia bacterium]|nr:hypothetical protein [Coriobacteriia bacterium]
VPGGRNLIARPYCAGSVVPRTSLTNSKYWPCVTSVESMQYRPPDGFGRATMVGPGKFVGQSIVMGSVVTGSPAGSTESGAMSSFSQAGTLHRNTAANARKGPFRREAFTGV